ncbi:alpha/beta fold hydrolase [Catellatospora chokoriensis]|uniref:Alpha/beta hydrolase fold protein n=1 Tax=Catellatospora chokoriensis TaxID=310353 RepID=A0A8J3K813_9ACTN|nr:alpha/beta hydrolase [Catellatospora chokoriensis]GIF94283.1 alpha/beta hydrolase fold protein [Catellatospora chokoriensis]
MTRPPATSGMISGISWAAAGAGDPLLLIQGLGYPAAMWFRLLPLLTPRRRVITFDNRGVGGSAAADTTGLTIEQMAADAALVLDACEISSADVLGVSLGGIVAQELALAHPARVRRLVLASTHTADEHAVPADDEVLAMFARRSQLSPEESLVASVPFVYAPSTPRALIEEDVACRARQPVPPGVYQAQLTAAVAFRGTWQRLPELTHETLFVHGTEDRVVPPVNAAIAAERVHGARLAWIEGGGHNLFSERSVDTAEAVNQFLGV